MNAGNVRLMRDGAVGTADIGADTLGALGWAVPLGHRARSAPVAPTLRAQRQ